MMFVVPDFMAPAYMSGRGDGVAASVAAMASRREESLRHQYAVAAMPRGERSSTPTRRWRRGERSYTTGTSSRRWCRGERRHAVSE